MRKLWRTRLRVVFLIAFGVILPLTGAMAQDLSWSTIRVKSEGNVSLCGPGTVTTAYTGNSAAFVFSKLGIRLDASTPHQAGEEFGACRIRSRVVIPKGYYLAAVTQNTQAGVVKSVGARGSIRTLLALQAPERFLGMRMPAFPGLDEQGRIIERSLNFAPKEEMNEPLLNLSGSFEASQQGLRYMCKFSKVGPVALDMEFRTAIRGQRKKPGSSVVIFVDSADVQLWVGTRLSACPA